MEENPWKPMEAFAPADHDTPSNNLIPDTHRQTNSSAHEGLFIDLAESFEPQEDDSIKTFSALKRAILSDFASEDLVLPVRTHVMVRGIPKSRLDEFEEKLWNMLEGHMPQPWVLKKAATLDKHETAWGRLDVQFKKQTTRLKRASKSLPQRAEFKYTLSMKFSGQGASQIAWNGWTFEWQDEVPIANETSVDIQFWQALEKAFPTFTAIDPELTTHWMRSQGLMPQILDKDLKGLTTEGHQYYPNGCLLTPHHEGGKQTYQLRQLQAIYVVPQRLDIAHIASMYCARNAAFVVAAESPVKLALYYQPMRSPHAWKSQLVFQDALLPEDVGLHVDDDLICVYTANRSQQQRGVEIQCLDRKTGLMRWQTRRLPGGLRGFAVDEEKLVFANDQAVFEISRKGEVLGYRRMETSSRLRRRLSCQLQDRLIFMPGPGQFAAWNMDKAEFDWQMNVIESDFIHCGKNHTFIFSEVGGYLLAYDVENQTPLWKFRSVSTPKDAWSYAEDIYFLFDRAILVLDRKTGRRKAQIPLPWAVSQFISVGHKLYLDASDAIYEWR